MANTTNFNWETPDDTDLVKDGAAAIRTLGSAIDTSLVDLKGGTTGQILSKATNTDMDFTWITNDVGDITEVVASAPLTGGGASGSVTVGIQDGTTAQKGAVQLENSTSSTSTTTAAVPASVKSAYDLANAAIPKSLIDAKGDLIVGSANDTAAILSVGTNNHVLTADSSATYGVKWAAAASGGGMTLLSTTTLTGSTVTVSSIDQTYNNLYLLIENAYPAADTYMHMTANSDTTSANYQASLIGLRNSTMAFRPDNKALHAYGMDSGTARNNLIAVTLFNYAGSTYKCWSSYASIYGDDTSPFFINSFGNTIWYSSAAITSLTFTMSASTFSGGTVKIYGVK